MKIVSILKNLGPGLLYAGAAVGVSHLVQSTRAGASYGFGLIGVLLLANILKYPFFEFAPRYAASTGKSLVHGYKKIGKWALVLYALFTLSTMFVITVAVSMVTAGLLGGLTGLSADIKWMTMGIMVLIMVFLIIGKFRILEKGMKYIILVLTVSTIFAIAFSFKSELAGIYHFDWTNAFDIAFLIAFVGWMPAPIDISVWHSTWTEAKYEEGNEKPNMRAVIRDFNIGYIGTAFLAIGFLALGAFVMYGSGQEFSDKGVAFAGQLVNMYTASLGHWAYYVIGVAAFTTMLSTSITVLDAYPRVLEPTFSLLLPSKKLNNTSQNKNYLIWMVVLVLGSWGLMIWFGKSMKFMVDLATTISFVTAPLLAILNYWAMMSIDKDDQAPKWLKIYAWVGMIFLSLFSVFYMIWKYL
ncbi:MULTISPECIES: Nramp family divalent metal transporter [unclassified Lentimicrobium]|uniref:Nramp family divalent metal transporter n=1 Tax=unclassified Lentimicrobium TaxID=2677434 RepID=UPI001557A74E|nr:MULTISPECIES: Nramp family divalent metal transporter [unclassified Lentimicrobium]NPD45766.1 Nramp family divalent metal transporter [Lentimicrobium sp. S6]NPD84781.1 Nramp family divalent metal transporter [Lentimicrobium sp. L6]